MNDSARPVLRVDDLRMHFPTTEGFFGTRKSVVRAVDGVSFDVMPGETLGLVGESGCGKSTLGRAIVQLYRPTSGRVMLDVSGQNVDLASLPESQMRVMRRHVQMVFQDPYASLNPRMTVGDIIAEPIRVHGLRSGAAVESRVRELMEMCGLNPRFIRRYPHEFSGGQRQRIGIARALAAEPRVLICDEPISALDVSIQAQIMNLLMRLQRELGLTYLFIAHDLAAVRHISTRIAVMYLGKIVEVAPFAELYRNPRHPYTQALISAVPIPDPAIEATRERVVLTGDLPSPRNPPSGCRFNTRCPFAMDRCRSEEPPLVGVGDAHVAACWLRAE
jgi:oligopeptide transport system ATP-binding protein